MVQEKRPTEIQERRGKGSLLNYPSNEGVIQEEIMGSRTQCIHPTQERKGNSLRVLKRSQENNYAADLENNKARLEEGDEEVSGDVSFYQKRKQATNLNILREYLHTNRVWDESLQIYRK